MFTAMLCWSKAKKNNLTNMLYIFTRFRCIYYLMMLPIITDLSRPKITEIKLIGLEQEKLWNIDLPHCNIMKLNLLSYREKEKFEATEEK